MKRIKNYRKSARLTKKHLIFLSVIDIIQGASYLNEVDYFTSRQNGHHISKAFGRKLANKLFRFAFKSKHWTHEHVFWMWFKEITWETTSSKSAIKDWKPWHNLGHCCCHWMMAFGIQAGEQEHSLQQHSHECSESLVPLLVDTLVNLHHHRRRLIFLAECMNEHYGD